MRISENMRLLEQDFATYVCPVCGDEKEIAEEYDLHSGFFYPVATIDTVCVKCDTYMERK